MSRKGPPDPGGYNIRHETVIYDDRQMDVSEFRGMTDTQENVSTKPNTVSSSIQQLKKPEVKNVSDNAQVNNTDNELFCNKYDFKYLHLYDAPHYVYIQHNDRNIGRLHPMAIGKLLYECVKNPKAIIKEITKLGVNRIKVTMTTISDINKLVENSFLKEKGYTVYVPKHLTERRGVIKGVYTAFSDEYLLEHMECKSKIKYCRRINKKLINNDGQVEYRATETVVLTFLGNKLPSYVDINGVRCKVEPYIGNVIQCYNCLRFGHVLSQCKASEKICKNCGINHEGDCDAQSLQCIHCKSTTHNSLYKKCPIYVKQQEIKKIMASNNLSFKDAKSMSEAPSFAQALTTKNKFSILENLNDEVAFPSLPPKTNDFPTSTQRKEFTSPIPKKRKALPQQEKHFLNPQREYNTEALPLTPISFNPHRPSTSGDTPEVIIENLTTYISNTLYKFKSSFSSEDEVNVRKTVSDMIKSLTFSGQT